MKCPICDVELLMADRQGIEIDYCPTCRGIWLDRGELEKLLERMSAQERGAAAVPREADGRAHDYRGHHGHHGGHERSHGHEHHGHHEKRKGFFHDIFDF